MATITNIRIYTQSKAVPNAGYIAIDKVMMEGNTIVAMGGDVRYVLGVVPMENIVVDTPSAPEECGCNTTNANIFATLIKGVDGVTPDMSDYYDKNVIDEKLGKKQDAISDLETIRSGAAKGATALQSVPSEYVTETELHNKGYATNAQVDAKQDKITDLDAIRQGADKGATAVQPASLANYISKDDVDAELSETSTNPIQNKAVEGALSDLANAIGIFLAEKQPVIPDLEAIRAGATKGATALQSSDVDSEVSETSTNPVQNKAVAGAFNEIVGLLEAGLSIVGERFDSKQDKLVSGENIKTINGESIIGEGNITIEGGSGGDLSGYATEEYVNNAVEAVNVKGEDGYVYSNGEKVDMRFTRSLIPVGTSIPANANLNTVAYLKVGKYYCSQNADAKTITNCPSVDAFSMEVFNPLSPVVDNETTAQYVYRLRLLTVYNTGVQYIQYCTVGSTVNKWTYNAWNIVPRSPFTLNSSKKGGSAALGSATQGVYVSSNGTLTKMTYTLGKSVPSSAVFTDTDTKVTAVANHYAPEEDESVVINAPEGEVIIGLKRDAAGHVVGVMSTPVSGAGGGGGGGGITVETDPIFSASPAASITEEKVAEWNNKYTKPSGGIPTTDLASDVQSALTAAESYKGTVIGVKANNATKMPADGIVDLGVVGTYSKPSTGIPKSDLNPSVQTSLEKADTAVQPEDLKDEVYIADFTMESLRVGAYNGTNVDCDVQGLVTAMNANKVILVREDEDSAYKGVYVLNGFAEDLLYFSIVGTDGDILWCEGTDYWDLQHIDGSTLRKRSWDAKQDTLVSGENIKTINGESILGSGDIVISGGGGVSGSAQLPANYISSNAPQLCTIPSGKVTIFSTPQTEGVKMQLSTVDMEPDKDNAWVIRLSIGTDNTSAYMVRTDDNSTIKWANGIAPTFENGKTYELSFRKIGSYFLGVWASFE